METKQKTMIFLLVGTIFALLTLFLFFCYSYFRVSNTPCNSFGWLLWDHSSLNKWDESQFLLTLSLFCGFIFSLSFRVVMMDQLPTMMNEATIILIILKSLSLFTALFYSFNQNSLFFFILNGLVVILSIFTYFIFSLLFKKLRLSFFTPVVPFFCFGYSIFSFLILALAPSFDPAYIQITSNVLELLFILYLGYMMWKIKKTVQDRII
ncbi:hypothetical protein AALA44_01295 [Enterococcus ratti]|uniref:hypothetical protein n=1 Tax=Enterococcus ratti TaxID=150033 RepID=UPI00351736A3